MIFTTSIGSLGQAEHAYTIRLPFTLSPGRTIKLQDGIAHFDLLGHKCQIAEETHQYSLTIRGFASESSATDFLSRTAAGLIWLGLKFPMGVRFSATVAPIHLFQAPRPIAAGSFYDSITEQKGWKEIDGCYSSDQTVVRQEHKRLLVETVGRATFRQDTPASFFADALAEALNMGRPEMVLNQPKLKLATELYASTYYEATPSASFLGRFTALEALLPRTPASVVIREMVNRFIEEARAAATQQRESAAINAEFQSVLTRLAHLRDTSIKSRIRMIIEEKLRNDPDIESSAALGREVSKLYDLRSDLVHYGTADPMQIRQGNTRLGDIVPRLLRVLFRQVAAHNPPPDDRMGENQF